MDNVEFDEEQYSQTTSSGQKPSKMAAKLIALGLVTDEKGANIVLVGLVLILLIIGFLFAQPLDTPRVPLDKMQLSDTEETV